MDFDVTAIHDLLNQAEQQYHALFDGHVPDQVARFGPHLDTVRMVVDESALQAPKDLV